MANDDAIVMVLLCSEVFEARFEIGDCVRLQVFHGEAAVFNCLIGLKQKGFKTLELRLFWRTIRTPIICGQILDRFSNECWKGQTPARRWVQTSKSKPGVESVLRLLFETLWSHFAPNSVLLLGLRWKVLTLAHPMVGKTSNSDDLGADVKCDVIVRRFFAM